MIPARHHSSYLTHYCRFPSPTTSRHSLVHGLPVSVGKVGRLLSFSPSSLAAGKINFLLESQRLQAENVFTLARKVAGRNGFPFSENSSITFTSPAALAFIVYVVSIKYVAGCCGKTILQRSVVEFPCRLLFKCSVVWGQQTNSPS